MLALTMVAETQGGVTIGEVLSNTYLVAFVSALLGFLFSSLLEWRKNRRLPRKQLSWDVKVDSRLVEIESELTSKVVVSYNGHPVKNLTNVIYRVTNTGNSVIKDQFLRFTFPERARLLEAGPDPTPEPELDVVEVTDQDKRPRERRWRIGHLEVGQAVGFRFVSDGGDWGSWTGVHPFNAEGEVNLQRRDIARVKADQEHVRPFFVYLILLLTLPAAFNISLISVAEVVRIAVVLALVGLLLPHLRPVARLVERMVVLLFDRTDDIFSANTLNTLRDAGGNVVQAKTISGDVTFHRPPEDDQLGQAVGPERDR